MRERGLPGLPSFLELEDVRELQMELSSSPPELEDSSELDDSSENGLLLSRVAFCNVTSRMKIMCGQIHIKGGKKAVNAYPL